MQWELENPSRRSAFRHPEEELNCICPQIVPKPRSRRAREGPRIENSIEACNVVPMKDKPSEATLASALLTYLKSLDCTGDYSNVIMPILCLVVHETVSADTF
ncbi:hypothetical protein PCH_Pc12g08510 [Penicillium rubens Wisconsin 54-1255]|uniref:Uncharacterized protein n=1 Tax=Penicillium rubens (strain ATCC 28089 / DSM 1075 / NRRL 1951 / Wisconsin 54-1255) TaxID=500485 RepID=B6GY98_PENRW|nr:hypothetical protein PCH_Pc12g08510 [Penicillium rubens Wisconsin 54-1255]